MKKYRWLLLALMAAAGVGGAAGGLFDSLVVHRRHDPVTEPSTQPPETTCGHQMSDWQITAATCETDGAKTRSCVHCGHAETESITPTGQGRSQHPPPAVPTRASRPITASLAVKPRRNKSRAATPLANGNMRSISAKRLMSGAPIL